MGVTRKVLKPGDNTHFPKRGDKVKIHYIGTLEDGTIFDSSRARASPLEAEIGVGKVIRGWDEGVPHMSLGEHSIMTVTSDYAYGEHGFPPVVPPNAMLVFDMELIDIN